MIKKIIYTSLISFIAMNATFAEEFKDFKNKLKSIDESAFDNVKVRHTDIEGIYEVTLKKGNILYIDKEVQNFIKGDIYVRHNGQLLNKTEQNARLKNKAIIEGIIKNYNDSIAYYPSKADKVVSSIYVFSDFTCPYCKKFHQDLNNINKAGIEVFYIPFPRKSLSDTGVVRGLQKIICSDNRAETFNMAFINPNGFVNGVKNDEISCPKSINVMEFNNYGNEMQIQGTPAIFTKNGSVIHGYNGALEFVTELKKNIEDEKLWGMEN